MKISGLQKLTLLDFPGRMACTVFLGGCNFRCPFCHNSQILGADAEEAMTEAALLAFLEKRKGILEGVVITGGEPTLQLGLPQLLEKIRGLGFRIKLDTNGNRPDVLRQLVEAGLVDYVAMDIKNSPQRYGATVGIEGFALDKVEESICYLLSGPVDYEFRTTLVQPLHDETSVRAMATWLTALAGGQKIRRFFLQPFVDRDTVPVAGLSAPEKAELEAYQAVLTPICGEVSLRGVG